MKTQRLAAASVAALGLLLATGCTTDTPPTDNATDDAATTAAEQGDEWFVQADYDEQLAQRDIEPEGDPNTPWLQAIEPEWVDTAEFAKPRAATPPCASRTPRSPTRGA